MTGFKFKTLAAAALLALGTVAAAPAFADALTVGGSAVAGADANGFGPTSGTDYVYESAFAGDGGSYGYAYAWGNVLGSYRADASGSGDFASTASFRRTLEVVNDNAYAARYTLAFYLYDGSLEVSGSGGASYALTLSKDAVALYSSAVAITAAGVAHEDNPLDGAAGWSTGDGFSYQWDGTTVSLDLGILGIGESMVLGFDLVATAFGEFASSGCEGGWAMAAAGDGCGLPGYASAGLGDPSGIDAEPPVPIVLTAVPVANAVPAPGTLALLGLGLGLGILAPRRRGGAC